MSIHAIPNRSGRTGGHSSRLSFPRRHRGNPQRPRPGRADERHGPDPRHRLARRHPHRTHRPTRARLARTPKTCSSSSRGTRFHAGCVGALPGPAVCGPHLFHLRVRPGRELLPAFLAWQINQAPFQRALRRAAEGSSQLSVRRPVLESLPDRPSAPGRPGSASWRWPASRSEKGSCKTCSSATASGSSNRIAEALASASGKA